MQIVYRRTVPYPLDRVLSQYFDLEHFAHVHPRTFGEARLVTCNGGAIVWKLIHPRRFGFRHWSTIFFQEYLPPNQIRSRVIKGLERGTEILTRLAQIPEGTAIEEIYSFPLPAWPWLVRLVEKWLFRKADRIWEEDLKVGLCHGGWPGIPKIGLKENP